MASSVDGECRADFDWLVAHRTNRGEQMLVIGLAGTLGVHQGSATGQAPSARASYDVTTAAAAVTVLTE